MHIERIGRRTVYAILVIVVVVFIGQCLGKLCIP